MELDHTDDAGMQMQKLTEAGNEILRLTAILKVVGNDYNVTKVNVLKAGTKEGIKQARIECQEAEGRYKGVMADIKCQKEIINIIKTLAKAEHNQF